MGIVKNFKAVLYWLMELLCILVIGYYIYVQVDRIDKLEAQINKQAPNIQEQMKDKEWKI